jgi:hypothetical protein
MPRARTALSSLIVSPAKEYGLVTRCKYGVGAPTSSLSNGGCGGNGFGSGTHGLHNRTFMPPFLSVKSDVPVSRLLNVGPTDAVAADTGVIRGGWTMN